MKIIVFSLGILLCWACSGEKVSEHILTMRGTSKAKHIEVVKVSEASVIHTKYSDYIDPESVKVIPLETTDQSLIAMADKIEIREEKIYIFDNKQHVVFVFTDKGQYIGKVDKFGKGPDEYPLACDFCVEGDWIGILNFDRLLFYNINEPDSVRIVRLDSLGANGLKMYSDQQYFYFRPSNTRTLTGSVIICDKEGKANTVLAEPKYALLVGVVFPPFFVPIEDKLYYYQIYNDTIYQVTDTALVASWVFDGGQHYTDEEIQNYVWKQKDLPGDGMFDFQHLFYADSALSFIVNSNRTQYQGYYSLASHQLKLVDMEDRNDDIFHSKLKWYPEAADSDGYFYGVIYPIQFSWLGIKPKSDGPFAGINEDSNPVLIKYKLKKF